MSSAITPDGHRRAPTGWNVLVTLAEPTYRAARNLLARWGQLRRTDYHKVATMTVADPAAFLCEFGDAVERSPGIFEAVSHLVPFGHMFDFKNPAELEAKAREVPLLRAGALGQVVPCATWILLRPWASA